MRFSRTVRSVMLGCVATTLALGLASCGGGVDKASFTEKLKAEADMKGMPEPALSCLADVALKYGDAKSLQSYMDGSLKSADDIKGLTGNKEAEQALSKCAQQVG